MLRRRRGGAWAGVLGGAQLFILYALAVGHFFGFLSWTPYFPFWPQLDWLDAHARWFFTTSPLGYDSYIGIALGALSAALHLGIAALLRSLRGKGGHPAQALVTSKVG